MYIARANIMLQTAALHFLSLRCALLSDAANGDCNNDYDDDDDHRAMKARRRTMTTTTFDETVNECDSVFAR